MVYYFAMSTGSGKKHSNYGHTHRGHNPQMLLQKKKKKTAAENRGYISLKEVESYPLLINNEDLRLGVNSQLSGMIVYYVYYKKDIEVSEYGVKWRQRICH